MVSTNLHDVDWSALPEPRDDGAADHLEHVAVPDLALASTDGGAVRLAALPGLTVLYAYPMTGRPGVPLPAGWDAIPGARGCTPEACAFRDHQADLRRAGADRVFGLSTQSPTDQREAVARLRLPFALLSDGDLALTRALALPTLLVDGMTLLRRLTLVIRDGRVVRVFYPVFPPDQAPQQVLRWLSETGAGAEGGR